MRLGVRQGFVPRVGPLALGSLELHVVKIHLPPTSDVLHRLKRPPCQLAKDSTYRIQLEGHGVSRFGAHAA